MTTLELSAQQAKRLKKILENYFSDLRMEIAATSRKDFRDKLKKDEELLKEVIAKL